MDIEKIANHVNLQLRNILITKDDVSPYAAEAISKTMDCFRYNNNKYYRNLADEEFIFHTGQYAIFLYYLSKVISFDNPFLASKIYYLNKILHSVDWYYEINLPVYWGVEHPLGSVLGRAEYKDGLYIYQGVTVGGANNDNKYPRFGINTIIYSNASVLGKTNIGDNVLIATGSILINENIPSNSIVFGRTPNLTIKQQSPAKIAQKIAHFWSIKNQ